VERGALRLSDDTPPGALVTVGLAGCAALPLYLIVARSLRVAELTELVSTATARLRR
jgi:hypothetical protein